MKHCLFLCFLLFGCATSDQTIDSLFRIAKSATSQQPTDSEVGAGLKEALVKGISVGTDLTSKIDGFYKNPAIFIPFPPAAKKAESALRRMGMGNQIDRFVMTLNRGAEAAASRAKPIFIAAIASLTIQDAWGILRGQPDAATQYLKRTTSGQLKQQFSPVMSNALQQVNATRYYGELADTYNKIPFVEKVNPDLNQYATDLAIQGLFYMIGEEEKKIRANPLERTSELLKKVFGSIT